MRFIAGMFLIVALSVGALAQEFKGATYKRPAGWDESTEAEVKTFAPKGLKEGELMAIIITGAVRTNGSSWEKQFTDTIALANDKGKASEVSEVKTQRRSDVTLLVQTLKLVGPPLGRHDRLYAQVSQGERRVFVTVLFNKDSLAEKYGQAISEFLANLGFNAAVTESGPPSGTSPGKIPTGNTPNLFMGEEGWRPSGTGLQIPIAKVVNGRPVGLWWRLDQTREGLKPLLQLFMPNGVQTKFPRMGGGMLFDYEGQKAQSGTNSLGTFSVSNGTFLESINGYDHKLPFSSGSDSDGAFFRTGGLQFRPLVALTNKSIAGVWVSKSSEYEFHADGTFESGTIRSTAQWSSGSMVRGKFVLDGFLIMIVPDSSAATIERIGLAGNMLAKSGTFYVRKKG